MRKLIDVPDEGLESLMGQNVTFFCWNYIYTGELVGVLMDKQRTPSQNEEMA